MKIVLNRAYRAATILKLSAREFEVFCDIACGHTPQQTAEKYGLSVKTVSTYRARVIDKLGVRSNQEIAVMAFRAGVTEVQDEVEERSGQKSLFPEEPEPSGFSEPTDGSGDTEGFSPAIGNHAGEVEGEAR